MLYRSVRLLLPMLCLSSLVGCAAAGPYVADLSGGAPGAHAIGWADDLTLHDPAQPRDIRLRVAYPKSPGRYPVVVFSHGAFCYPQLYAAITDHWVSRGYVVVLPEHPDSPNLQPPLRPDQMGGLTATRIADLNFILGHLDEIAAAAGIPGQLDTDRLAVAGHSYGTVIAMAKAGLWIRTPDGGRRQYRDPRIRGAVLMSGVGQMDEMMAPDAFSGLAIPLIATGGTLDVGNTGGPVIHPWEWRMSPYTLAPPGDKYSVVLENGDHYLGGVICRADRGGEDDPAGAAIDAGLTLAFLDAYVKEDARAMRFLATADVPALTAGRARFSRK
ncbi:MAG: hypothetical protein JNK40_03490 [Chromatiales bacterium]|nr:hypothetical protein [Chromatiales bacterium]